MEAAQIFQEMGEEKGGCWPHYSTSIIVLLEGCEKVIINREKWKAMPEKKVKATMTILT